MKETTTQIVAILNISPESFSGDGLSNRDEILKRAEILAALGADVIDIGAQSTQPGSAQLTLEVELNRTAGLITAIKSKLPNIRVSIDTTQFEVAEQAVNEGVDIINDISGGRFDERILKLVATNPNLSFVLMHSRGSFTTMHRAQEYKDVVSEIKQYFTDRVKKLLEAGIRKEQIILDPGIGFSKGLEENLEIIRRFEEFNDAGFPIYIGLSRKKFIGKIINEDDPVKRDHATSLFHLLCLQKGVKYIRTHNVAYLRQVVQVHQA